MLKNLLILLLLVAFATCWTIEDEQSSMREFGRPDLNPQQYNKYIGELLDRLARPREGHGYGAPFGWDRYL